ncbi:MAG: His/Gly/Thr/Pro-type tRNA ligase C-terminal domain-containing protein, partial [Candidatus Nitrosocaldus sp.]
LHNSPSGAVERVMYALLEKAYRMQKEGKAPMLPLWLSPTQVRLIPVSVRGAGKGKGHDEGSEDDGSSSNKSGVAGSITYMDYCNSIMHRLEGSSIRVDVDDRDESVGKKIREAEMEWIPYIVVVGEKEIASNRLSVRERVSDKIREMSVEELAHEIEDALKDKPYMPLNMPKYLSMRPQIMV